jgi:SAM-dependent methyltransferase
VATRSRSDESPQRSPPALGFLAAIGRIERDHPACLAGPALDLACGGGRHALVLARRGIETWALDRDPQRIARLTALAAAESLPLHAIVGDLEAADFDLARDRYSLIVVVNYLHRPLFAPIERALRPGGALFYHTFTTGTTGTTGTSPASRPSNPAFLLAPGELKAAFAGLTILEYDEGLGDGAAGKATLLARRA